MTPSRFLALGLLAFTLLASYEAARPPIESLFLARHGSEALPMAWLLVAVGALGVVALYNRLATRIALLPLLALTTAVSAILLFFLLFAADLDYPGHAWALYVWKDLYIVVVLENFWALANTTTRLETARRAYGGLLVFGTLGALGGGTVAGWVAAEHGLTASLELTLPILLGVLILVVALRRLLPEPKPKAPTTEVQGDLAVLRQSAYLVPLLLLILVVQLVTTLVDYGYNSVVTAAYPDADARTVAISQVYRAVNVAALALQLGTGLVLMLGLTRVFVGLPVLVGLTVLGLALHPVFLVAAAAKVVGKSVDYSLFRACKEMLYIPLTYAEQTQGKAVVDVLTYRVAKGGAALLLKGLLLVGLAAWSLWLAVGLMAAWGVLAVVIVRRYRQVQP